MNWEINYVATVLTVYGIETLQMDNSLYKRKLLQQYLPFTVLKLNDTLRLFELIWFTLQQYLPFTVLKLSSFNRIWWSWLSVATVLTVYGIETIIWIQYSHWRRHLLQQYLPFTVLKHWCSKQPNISVELQQYLPFTVCAVECEALEVQSVGKTKLIKGVEYFYIQ